MKNTLYIAACSAVKEIDGATWFQTFPPYGRYPVGGIIPGAPEGAEFVFDEAAAKSIIENFRAEAKKTDWPGILVDREHFSADREKTSDAMAWAKDIRQEADGSIWTRWEFTAPGKELWEGKVLINRSPLFACAKDGKTYHPLALKSIGMTNTPHFTELSTLAAAKEWNEESHPRIPAGAPEGGQFAPAMSATMRENFEKNVKSLIDVQTTLDKSYGLNKVGLNNVLNSARGTLSHGSEMRSGKDWSSEGYTADEAGFKKAVADGVANKAKNVDEWKTFLGKERERGRQHVAAGAEALRQIHKRAILLGFKYDPKTKLYK